MVLCGVALAAAAIGPATAVADTWTDADFAGGTPDAGAAVVAPGVLQLKANRLTIDFGPLPADWEPPHTWEPGGSIAPSGTGLGIDAARTRTNAIYSAGQVLEFRGTFGAATFQHVGFGLTLDAAGEASALFSTGSDGVLRARTTTNGVTSEVSDAIANPTTAHVFRIEWGASSVTYKVDGTVVATHNMAIAAPLHVVASDLELGGASVTLDTLDLLSYLPSGNFESRVFDSGRAGTTWGTLTPAPSTGVVLKTRSGGTPTYDAARWSDWQPVGSGGAIASPRARYLQYRVELSTADTRTTPTLDQVAATYTLDTVAPTASIGAVAVSGTTATVTFSSPATDVERFECRLDSGAFAACTSPKALSGLRAGQHTVAVRAVDQAGNVGAAAEKAFAVLDRTAPKLTLTSRSLKVTRSGKVKLRLRCPAGESRCVVSVKLRLGRATVAKGKATIAGGKTATVSLKLSKAARKRLAKAGRLKLKALIVASDAAGNRSSATIAVTVRGR